MIDNSLSLRLMLAPAVVDHIFPMIGAAVRCGYEWLGAFYFGHILIVEGYVQLTVVLGLAWRPLTEMHFGRTHYMQVIWVRLQGFHPV